jgi:hypothetical protein
VAELKRTVTKKSADVKLLKTEAVKLKGIQNVSSSGYGGGITSKSLEVDPLQWRKTSDISQHWPKPRSKSDLAVSSTMVPSNLARASGLHQLSSSLKQIEDMSALEREDQLQAQLLQERASAQQLVVALEGELERHLGAPKGRVAAEVARKLAASSSHQVNSNSSTTSPTKRPRGFDPNGSSVSLPMLN